MDLSPRLARAATRRASVLIVEVPGWELVRCAIQQELRTRGWREATSPADADALAVGGRPGADLGRCIALVWQQLPGPRAQTHVTVPTAVGAALDQVLADLVDDDRQRADADARPVDAARADAASDAEPAGADPGDDRGGGHDDMDDHGHGDDGGMDMPMPGGIPLAGEGPDRDGLDLDELHVPLGPILPAWSAGLVLQCTLQGDLVTAARAHVLAGEPPPPGVGLVHGSPADRLDRAARLLTVAGWEEAATAAARTRDRLLFSGGPDEVRPEVERLAGRVRRSRMLRWSLADVPGVRDRLLGWLQEARDALAGKPTPVAGASLDSLGERVLGRELGAARLLVAAADVDVAGLVGSGADLS